ncbi:MAG: hypothetical protein ACFHX7_11215 [Pseudomonadota bacterium]
MEALVVAFALTLPTAASEQYPPPSFRPEQRSCEAEKSRGNGEWVIPPMDTNDADAEKAPKD